MENRIKRFITCHVPVDACNFKCPYCYLSQLNAKDGAIHKLCMKPEDIAKSLSVERLGGICYFNLCGNGETMMHPQLVDLVYELTKAGHYCDIITNGTISVKFDELLNRLSKEQLSRLFVKFSFHYLELKRLNMLELFADNVAKIKNSPASFSIEVTPCDEYIPHIEEIKNFSLEHFGALPHVTVTRDESTDKIALLTSLSREEYKKTWSQFDSAMFDFKFSIFNQKRKEFCHAGDWSFELNLQNGIYTQCYHGKVLGNIKDMDKPLYFEPIGYCPIAHCFNSHAFLAFGDIPELQAPTYAEERNRVTPTGEWLKPNCKEFFSTKVYDNNHDISQKTKKEIYQKAKSRTKKATVKRNIKFILKGMGISVKCKRKIIDRIYDKSPM